MLHGASPKEKTKLGETALILASQSGQSDVVRQLIEAGAPVEEQSPSGTSPLIEAARSGDEQTLNTLLARGANQRATLRDGTSAADIARRFGHTRIANRLRKAGASSLRDTPSRAATKRLLANAGDQPGAPARRRAITRYTLLLNPRPRCVVSTSTCSIGASPSGSTQASHATTPSLRL